MGTVRQQSSQEARHSHHVQDLSGGAKAPTSYSDTRSHSLLTSRGEDEGLKVMRGKDGDVKRMESHSAEVLERGIP